MKNRIYWYIMAAFITSIIIIGCVLMPELLLNQTGDNTLNNLYTVNNNPFTITTTASSTVQSKKALTTRVQLFMQGQSNSTLSTQYASDSIDMKKAVDSSIEQIAALLKKNAIPSLGDFPQAYTVNAEPRTITDGQGNAALQYWNVNFVPKAGEYQTRQGVSLALDAQTGMILSMSVVVTGNGTTVDLVSTAETMAQEMNMPGRLLSLNQLQAPQTAVWQFNDTTLTMQLMLENTNQLTSLVMYMSTSDTVVLSPT